MDDDKRRLRAIANEAICCAAKKVFLHPGGWLQCGLCGTQYTLDGKRLVLKHKGKVPTKKAPAEV